MIENSSLYLQGRKLRLPRIGLVSSFRRIFPCSILNKLTHEVQLVRLTGVVSLVFIALSFLPSKPLSCRQYLRIRTTLAKFSTLENTRRRRCGSLTSSFGEIIVNTNEKSSAKLHTCVKSAICSEGLVDLQPSSYELVWSSRSSRSEFYRLQICVRTVNTMMFIFLTWQIKIGSFKRRHKFLLR